MGPSTTVSCVPSPGGRFAVADGLLGGPQSQAVARGHDAAKLNSAPHDRRRPWLPERSQDDVPLQQSCAAQVLQDALGLLLAELVTEAVVLVKVQSAAQCGCAVLRAGVRLPPTPATPSVYGR